MKIVVIIHFVTIHRVMLVAVSATTLSLWTSLSVAAAPSLKDRQQAQRLVVEAKQLLAGGKIDQALKNYKKAEQLVPQVTTKTELAKIQTDLGDFVEALGLLEAAVATPAPGYNEKRAQTEAQKLLSALEARTPKLTIEVFKPEVSKVTLTIDKEDLEPGEHRLNPGKHVVAATAKGFAPWSKGVELVESENQTIEISMKRSGDEDEAQNGPSMGVPKWAVWLSWGVTAAALGAGTGFGVVAIQTTNQVLADYGCQDGKCPARAESDLDIAKFNGNVSTASFAIAGAGLVTASVLTVLAYQKRTPTDEAVGEEQSAFHFHPLLGPGFIGANGSF